VLYKHERGKIMSVTFKTSFPNIESEHGQCFMSEFGMIILQPENSSSVVKATWHDFNALYVTFTSSPDSCYCYEGVTFRQMVQLLNADSVGSFIAKEIKPNHEVIKIR